mgnify:CR=1 FL=1
MRIIPRADRTLKAFVAETGAGTSLLGQYANADELDSLYAAAERVAAATGQRVEDAVNEPQFIQYWATAPSPDVDTSGPMAAMLKRGVPVAVAMSVIQAKAAGNSVLVNNLLAPYGVK